MSSLRSSIRQWMVLSCTTIASFGCGGTTNFNKVFGGDDASTDTKFGMAQIAYDRGNFSEAEKLLTEIVSTNSANERASVLLAYVHLSQAGVDPFVLARQLITMSKSSSSTSTSSALVNELDLSPSTAEYRQDLATEELDLAPTTVTTTRTSGGSSSSGTSGSTSSGVASVLVKLQDLITLSDSEEQKLYLRQFNVSDTGTSESQLVLFGDSNTLMLPNEVSATLRAAIDVLNNLDTALKDVCAFVDPDIITTEAQRGTSTTCTATTRSRKYSNQAHFVWALSHLAEAVTLQRALLYVPDGQTQPAIDVANAKAATLGTSDLETLINAMTEIVAATTKVFDVANSKSMTQTTLTDLQMVSLAFAKIANMPASIQQSITSSFEALTSISKQAAGGVTAANNAKAFKTQVTTTLTKTLSSKIQTVATSNKATAEQVTQLCASFSQLTADATAGSTVAQSKPAACTN